MRQALGRAAAEVGEWQARPIYGGLGAAWGTRGIYRCTGVAHAGTDALPWAVVLKVLRGPAPGTPEAQTIGNPAHQDYWKREVLTYQSGITDALPDGLAAPQCFSLTEDAEQVHIWMEDLGDTGDAAWSVSRFATAARHLGRFGGTYLAQRPVPDYPWLLRALLRQRADHNAPFWARLDQVRAHPLLQRGWPGDLADRARQLFDERHAFLAVLDRLPQTPQHGDADRRNLLDRGRSRESLAAAQAVADAETVAIDWAFTGVGPVGQELAALVVSSVLWFKGVGPGDLPVLDRACFAAYVAGLRDAGWQGDEALARLGYAATAALRYGPLLGIVSVVSASDEQRGRIEQTIDFTDAEALAAILRITGGNFWLLERLLTEIARISQVNQLQVVTSEVVETARESLVVGAA